MELEMYMICGFVANYIGNPEAAKNFYEQSLNVNKII